MRLQAVTLCHILGGSDIKSAWSALQSTPGLMDALVALTSETQEFSAQFQHIPTLERVVVVLYSKVCDLKRDKTRLRLAMSGKRH